MEQVPSHGTARPTPAIPSQCSILASAEGTGDEADAEMWWQRAVDAGETVAMFNLGWLSYERGDKETAETWWQRGAQAGDAACMVGFGRLLERQGELAKHRIGSDEPMTEVSADRLT